MKSLQTTVTKPAVLVLTEIPVPEIAANEVLVKVSAVALNPTDWKHRDFFMPVGASLGCDFSGVVVKIGADVKNAKLGERVAGFVHGGLFPTKGSFAEYLHVEYTLTWRVPDNIGDEEAAAMGGVGPHTAVQALCMRLGVPFPSAPSAVRTPILLWSGATSVCMYAIQIAKLAGFEVITTASAKNHALLKKLGADAIYDYADPETPAKIRAAYPTLSKALDGIAEGTTTASCAASMAGENSKIITLLPNPLVDGPANVEVEATLAYCTLGVGFEWVGWAVFPAMPKDKSMIEEWLLELPALAASGKFVTNPIWSQPGGLAKINEGLELLKAGKTSANKITYKI